MSADFLIQLLGILAGACGVYAAIRADLTRAILIAERAEKQADSAHHRLTTHVEVHHSTH